MMETEQQMEIYPLGVLPPLGVVPPKMHAITIRKERYGDPIDAYRQEIVDTPELGKHEVLIAVMYAGLNHNNIWAGKGAPLNVINAIRKDGGKEDFMISGSDGTGIVYKVGEKVTNVKVGDEIIIMPAYMDNDDYDKYKDDDISIAPSLRAWGYETNWGSLAQFCVVKKQMCIPKPSTLDWKDAGCLFVSGATAHHMLSDYTPNVVKKGTPVLIWGGAGGLGSFAIQLTKLRGGIPVAIVNNEEKAAFCKKLGAEVINRSNYDHWDDFIPDKPYNTQRKWLVETAKFIRDIKKLTGGELPHIVLEHPGQATFPTSLIACKPGGMVITCGATTGYMTSIDLRYLWLEKKRLQGAHFIKSMDTCYQLVDLIDSGQISPLIKEISPFDKTPEIIQKMAMGGYIGGNFIVAVGASLDNY